MVLWPRPRAGRQRWVGHDLGAEYVVDPPHEVLAELDARCLNVLPYLLRPGGADDGRGDVRVLQRPGDGQLGQRQACLVGDRLELSYPGQDRLGEVVPDEVGSGRVVRP